MSWADANQEHLLAAMAAVGEHLDRHAAGSEPKRPSKQIRDDIDAANDALDGPGAIDHLTDVFQMSSFERNTLLMLAAIELDSSFPARCAAASGDAQQTQPTFALALAALPDPHWTALSPSGPLRHWRMVEIGPGDSLTTARLRIDERILHNLTGLDLIDERLQGYMEPIAPLDRLVPSHQDVAKQIVEVWSNPRGGPDDPVVHLTGPDAKAMARIASAAAASMAMQLFRIVDIDIPTAAAERELLTRLWERDAALSGRVLLISHGDSDAREHAARFANCVGVPIVLAGRDAIELRDRSTIRIEVHRPTAQEQFALWSDANPPEMRPPAETLERVIRQFDLGDEDIRAASLDYRSRARALPDDELGSALWQAALRQSRPRGEDLAQRIEAEATWNDLVLPGSQVATLHEIASQVRHRTTVYDDWGFGERESRGLGISALFSGSSGTGKTMAAEVLANSLELDLLRIDLSRVVSKYIGETEKNLRRVFDAAEVGGSILLFDEADALFGKRSEVKDSHDRYANIEVSYLLQRMETYRGLAILTTNMRDALDPAFLRRIRFLIEFRFPDQDLREQIWLRAFPEATPTLALEPATLSQVAVAGGNIRNIALNAAFMAAGDGVEVTMAHL
ncbi:MAG: AAA family ATPase, partial [bacterium]|nr:AAA family ATPase [bacterium]